MGETGPIVWGKHQLPCFFAKMWPHFRRLTWEHRWGTPVMRIEWHQFTHRKRSAFIPIPKKGNAKECSKLKWKSCRSVFVTPWTVAYQAPPSMGFSRQEYWSGLPLPSPGRNYIYIFELRVVSASIPYEFDRSDHWWSNSKLFILLEETKFDMLWNKPYKQGLASIHTVWTSTEIFQVTWENTSLIFQTTIIHRMYMYIKFYNGRKTFLLKIAKEV